VGFTKSLFEQFCLLDKSKKESLEVFNYKTPCMFISYSVACTK
jgi:hypothetical protein